LNCQNREDRKKRGSTSGDEDEGKSKFLGKCSKVHGDIDVELFER
jgi:hypothetical protein